MMKKLAKRPEIRAPQNLERLMGMGLVTFTAEELTQKMQIPLSEVRLMIHLGIQQEKLRVAMALGRFGRANTLYECVTWRRQWMSKPWRPSNGQLTP